MVVVKFDEIEAIVNDGRWTSGVLSFSNALNYLSFGLVKPGELQPDKDLFIANEMIQIMGGDITYHEPPEPLEEGWIH